jgi:hypothetical protein
VPRHISRAGLQVRPEGVDAAELEQVWLLDLWPAELLQLLQPAAQHRLDALVYLKAYAKSTALRESHSTGQSIRDDRIEPQIDNDLTSDDVISERGIEKRRAKAQTWNGLMVSVGDTNKCVMYRYPIKNISGYDK